MIFSLETREADVVQCPRLAATRRHTQAPRWRDETSGLAFDGPTGIVGPGEIGGTYLANAGNAKGLLMKHFRAVVKHTNVSQTKFIKPISQDKI